MSAACPIAAAAEMARLGVARAMGPEAFRGAMRLALRGAADRLRETRPEAAEALLREAGLVAVVTAETLARRRFLDALRARLATLAGRPLWALQAAP
jgi:hypothetical protein